MVGRIKNIGDITMFSKEQTAKLAESVAAALATYDRLGEKAPAALVKVGAATASVLAGFEKDGKQLSMTDWITFDKNDPVAPIIAGFEKLKTIDLKDWISFDKIFTGKPMETWSAKFIDGAKQLPAQIIQAFTSGGGWEGALQGSASTVGATAIGSWLGEAGKSGITKGMTGLTGQMLSAAGPAVGALAGPLIGRLVSHFNKPEHVRIMQDVGRQWGVDISEGLAKQIEADAAKHFGGDRAAGSLFNLDKIIGEAGGLTDGNFEKFTRRLRDVFAMFESGKFTVAEAAQVIDKNWSAFVQHGTDGNGRISASLKEIIALNERLGVQSKEIAAWQQTQATAALSGFAAVAAGIGDPYRKIGESIKKAREDMRDAQTAAEKLHAKEQKSVDEWLSRAEREVQRVSNERYKSDEAKTQAIAAANEEYERALRVFDGLNERNLDGIQLSNDYKKALEGQLEAWDKLNILLQEQQALAAAAKQELEDVGIQAVASFSAAVASGMSFSEALKVAAPGLKSLDQAFEDLGVTTDNVALRTLLLQSTILDKNPLLVEAIGGLNQQMVALDNLNLLNEESFASMQRTAFTLYTRLQGEVHNTADASMSMEEKTRQALIPMQGYLQEAARQAALLKVPIDANTQSMIDQSKQLGIWREQGKTDAEIMEGGFRGIADAVKELKNFLEGVVTASNNIPRRVEQDFIQNRYTVDHGTTDASGDYPPHAEGAFIRKDHTARVHAGEIIGPIDFMSRALEGAIARRSQIERAVMGAIAMPGMSLGAQLATAGASTAVNFYGDINVPITADRVDRSTLRDLAYEIKQEIADQLVPLIPVRGRG